jgi:hypothetical protein
MTAPPATRTDDVETGQRRDAPGPHSPCQAREANDDPGAIIDWLLKEGTGK